MSRFITAAVLALLVTVGHAQSPATAKFDVASVKVNRSGAPIRSGPSLQPGGRVVATNVPLRDLIRAAYDVDENQIIGAPDWVFTALFDIEARGPVDLTREQAQAMLRDLLADRFTLRTHAETRQLPIYRLVMARPDRAVGTQIKPAGAECAPIAGPAGAPMPPPPPPATGGGGVPLTAARGMARRCPTLRYPGGISARAVTLEFFAGIIAPAAGRPVVNETALPGEFDIDLAYTPDLGAGPSPVAPAADSPPSLFTALEEQLGLELEASRGPVQVLVIDRVEVPTGN
jgi:uncharacterized protein (TIGR03435 family)